MKFVRKYIDANINEILLFYFEQIDYLFNCIIEKIY